MRPAKRARLLAEAHAIALARAAQWRQYKDGRLEWRLITAPSLEGAQKLARKRKGWSYNLQPVLSTSEWREIYREVGL